MEYNEYQKMDYKAKFGNFTKKEPYKGNWDLIYMGQFIVKNAAYAICKKAKIELEKNKFTIKNLIIFDKTLYPTMFKSFPAAETIQDLTFLKDLQTKTPINTIAVASTQTYSAGAGTTVVASKSYNIQFATGSAILTPEGKATVNEIAQGLLVANALKASIDGFTDNTGSETVNQSLSEARAAAVKAEIQSVSPSNFPDSRFTVAGHGSAQPIGDNSTSSGRAANRRVRVQQTKG